VAIRTSTASQPQEQRYRSLNCKQALCNLRIQPDEGQLNAHGREQASSGRRSSLVTTRAVYSSVYEQCTLPLCYLRQADHDKHAYHTTSHSWELHVCQLDIPRYPVNRLHTRTHHSPAGQSLNLWRPGQVATVHARCHSVWRSQHSAKNLVTARRVSLHGFLIGAVSVSVKVERECAEPTSSVSRNKPHPEQREISGHDMKARFRMHLEAYQSSHSTVSLFELARGLLHQMQYVHRCWLDRACWRHVDRSLMARVKVQERAGG
jgi:hypothetical protein